MPTKKTEKAKHAPKAKGRRQRKAYPEKEYSSDESESDKDVEPINKKVATDSWLGGQFAVYPINYNHASMPFY
jgi:hypothetical protein